MYIEATSWREANRTKLILQTGGEHIEHHFRLFNNNIKLGEYLVLNRDNLFVPHVVAEFTT